MNKTTLDEEEVEELSKLFKYINGGAAGFKLTFYNGHLRDFYKFLAYQVRSRFPHLDRYGNSEMFSVNNLVKHHGTSLGIYPGSWVSGVQYQVTLQQNYGVLGEEILFIHVVSEDDDVDMAIRRIDDAISDVINVWGPNKITEAIFKKLAASCKLQKD